LARDPASILEVISKIATRIPPEGALRLTRGRKNLLAGLFLNYFEGKVNARQSALVAFFRKGEMAEPGSQNTHRDRDLQ
jgi:hypothetical protein